MVESQRTLRAYRPAFLMPIFFATSELVGSIMITSPLQSSLRLFDLQFGQMGPLLTNLQFLQAFSLKLLFPHGQLWFV